MDRTLVHYSKIPPDATQVFKYNAATNATVIVYTVTAGKTLYLSQWVFSVRSNAAGFQGNLYVRDADDLNPVYIAQIALGSAGHLCNSGNPNPAIEILAGYDVVVDSNNAGLGSWASIHGWEE